MAWSGKSEVAIKTPRELLWFFGIIMVVTMSSALYFGGLQDIATATPQARTEGTRPQWELVTTFNNGETYRLRVHGGWLYRHSDGMAFVPEDRS